MHLNVAFKWLPSLSISFALCLTATKYHTPANGTKHIGYVITKVTMYCHGPIGIIKFALYKRLNALFLFKPDAHRPAPGFLKSLSCGYACVRVCPSPRPYDDQLNDSCCLSVQIYGPCRRYNA